MEVKFDHETISVLNSCKEIEDVEIETRCKVTKCQYDKIKEFFISTGLESSSVKSIEKIDKNIRKIRILPNYLFFKQKIQHQKLTRKVGEDIYHIVISTEKYIKNVSIDDFIPNIYRYKERCSFIDSSISIDLTTVTNAKSEYSYEIEVEVLDSSDRFWIKRMEYALTKIFEIICRPSLTKIIGQKFIGALPKTLCIEDLPYIKNNNYMASPKYDGERKLLFRDSFHYFEVYNRNMEYESLIKIENPKVHPYPILLDVEFIQKEIVILDIIIFGKLDMREQKINLIQRLDICSRFVSELPNCRSKVYFRTKEIKKFIQKHPQIEGIILTPTELSYSAKSRDEKIYKWKPNERQSIDFRAILDANRNEWIPYLCYPSGEKSFEDSEGKQFIIEKSDVIKNADIVEAVWSKDRKVFSVVAIRKDKKKPNFITTALDIWSSIIDPVKVEMIKDKNNK